MRLPASEPKPWALVPKDLGQPRAKCPCLRMAQLGKHLLCECEDLSSDPQNQFKKLSAVVSHLESHSGDMEWGMPKAKQHEALEAPWPAVLDNVGNFQANKRPSTEKKMNNIQDCPLTAIHVPCTLTPYIQLPMGAHTKEPRIPKRSPRCQHLEKSS